MLKKIFNFFMMFLLLFGTIGSTIHVDAAKKIRDEGEEKYKVDFLKKNDSHQKVKFTNLETGNEEYLESSLVDGKYTYTATVGIQQYNITSDETTITITDQDNNVILLDKEQVENELLPSDDGANDELIQPLGLYDDVPMYTDWTTYNYFYSSEALNIAYVSLIAGILASIYGGPVTGVLTSIATFYAGIKAENCYYFMQKQTRFYKGERQVRNVVTYYKYYDHKDSLGTVYESPRTVCFTCL